ncbi:hypothetical protein GCM10023189_19710 [Nibrella saemangeumensis]|uniref:EboA domain-containing protein n=1 Tax=Nibrella saemangeumensis TaxID=1084526 RepID=A0ABP8MSK9_9BACT
MDTLTLRDTLFRLIEQQPNAEKAVTWLRQQADMFRQNPQTAVFYRIFTSLPRFTGKAPVTVPTDIADALNQLRPGFQVHSWTLDRLARVWWLLQLPAEDESSYVKTITELFKSAELNELVALYSALPVLAFPEAWRFQASEGVRNNIGDVQAAIMLRNPYPADYLDELAWNQLVMKAFFTEKDVTQIIDFEQRTNENLAQIVIDYARERKAAGRSIHPNLWHLVKPFVTDQNKAELTQLFDQ